jgi:hypothetical protein
MEKIATQKEIEELRHANIFFYGRLICLAGLILTTIFAHLGHNVFNWF